VRLRCGYGPSINQTAFSATPASNFWSSSSYVADPASAWYVSFFSGVEDAFDESSVFYVRLVRGGQPFDSFDAADPISDSIFTDGFE